MARFIAIMTSGIAQGAISTLVALGLVLVHKASGIINLAQGDLLTFSGYLGVWLIMDRGWALAPAYVVILAIMFLAGVALERVGYAPVRRRPPTTIMITTLAIGLVIQALLAKWKGTTPLRLRGPFGNDVWHVAGAAIPYQNLLVLGATLIVVIVLILAFGRTSRGRQVRALAADREMALLMGVRANVLSMATFGIAGMLAGLGGLLLGPLLSVYPTLGFVVLLNGFAAAIIGGFDRLEGVAFVGLLLSIAQTLATGYISADYAVVYPYVLLIIVLAIRPEGLVRSLGGIRY
jgi:branched-chain amino acid transport system permease protein